MTAALTCPSCGHQIAPPKGEFLMLGNLALRTDVCAAYAFDEPIGLAYKPCMLLAALMRYPGRTLPRSYLMDAIDCWGSPANVSVYICELRRRLGHVVTICTRWGAGYSIHPSDEEGVKAATRVAMRRGSKRRQPVDRGPAELDRVVWQAQKIADDQQRRQQIEREAWPR